jgi:hypothetical protein
MFKQVKKLANIHFRFGKVYKVLVWLSLLPSVSSIRHPWRDTDHCAWSRGSRSSASFTPRSPRARSIGGVVLLLGWGGVWGVRSGRVKLRILSRMRCTSPCDSMEYRPKPPLRLCARSQNQPHLLPSLRAPPIILTRRPAGVENEHRWLCTRKINRTAGRGNESELVYFGGLYITAGHSCSRILGMPYFVRRASSITGISDRMNGRSQWLSTPPDSGTYALSYSLYLCTRSWSPLLLLVLCNTYTPAFRSAL